MRILKLQVLKGAEVFHRKMWKKRGTVLVFLGSKPLKALKLQVPFDMWKSVHEQKRNARMRGKK